MFVCISCSENGLKIGSGYFSENLISGEEGGPNKLGGRHFPRYLVFEGSIKSRRRENVTFYPKYPTHFNKMENSHLGMCL